jgi:hypothetical protein
MGSRLGYTPIHQHNHLPVYGGTALLRWLNILVSRKSFGLTGLI